MLFLSRWASRHRAVAVVLILLGEVANLVNGLLLGTNGANLLPPPGLTLLTLALLGGAFWVRTQWIEGQSYARSRRVLLGAFLGNFLLAIAVGGLGSAGVDSPDGSNQAWGSSRVIMRTDTVNNLPDASFRAAGKAVPHDSRPAGRQVGKRLLFVLLFVAGLGLTYLLAVLGCALLCSGLGFYAALALAGALGSLGGAYFFLSRAFARVIRPWREMTRSERRNTILRALALFLIISLLLGALAN